MTTQPAVLPVDAAGLARLQELEGNATPGPWQCSADRTGINSRGRFVAGYASMDYDCLTTGDAEFIAAMRTLSPELAAALVSLRCPECRLPLSAQHRWRGTALRVTHHCRVHGEVEPLRAALDGEQR